LSRTEIGNLQQSLEATRAESLTDPLTGLANRNYFDRMIKTAVKASHASGEPLSLLMFDIDHFKSFSDTYGHLTGDQVLRLVGMSLKHGVKKQDISARYGGEEFAILLPNTTLRESLTVADQVRRRVMDKELKKKSTGEILGRVTISAGVSLLKGDDDTDALIERADACLYAAKHTGRNRVICEIDAEYMLNAGPGSLIVPEDGRRCGLSAATRSGLCGRDLWCPAVAWLAACPAAAGLRRRLQGQRSLCRRLTRPWPLLQRGAPRGVERGPGPFAEFFGVVEQPGRQLPVGRDRHRSLAGLIREGLRAFGLEARNGLLVGPEIEARPQGQCEVDAVDGDAEAGEHRPDRDGAEIGEQIGQELTIHRAPRSLFMARRGSHAHPPTLPAGQHAGMTTFRPRPVSTGRIRRSRRR
jgi:diguanylate cyclase (GGDEF)-like protein